MSGIRQKLDKRNWKEHSRFCRLRCRQLATACFVTAADLPGSAPSRQTEAPGTEELAVIENRNDYGQLG